VRLRVPSLLRREMRSSGVRLLDGRGEGELEGLEELEVEGLAGVPVEWMPLAGRRGGLMARRRRAEARRFSMGSGVVLTRSVSSMMRVRRAMPADGAVVNSWRDW